MAEDQRNFRYNYYSKVGFPSVEEKKSLQHLLKFNELDDVKLMQFCLRFPLPSMYRMLTWKVLLKILPRFQSNHDFVWRVKCDIYRDYYLALLVMNVAVIKTPNPIKFLKMHLMSERRLRFNHTGQEKDEESQHFLALANVFAEMCESDEETYWLTKNFFANVQKFTEHFPSLIDTAQTVLKKEGGDLHAHLESLSVYSELPEWFGRAYAGILPVASLVRIWDRIMGGSVRILAFVAVALLIAFRRNLLLARDTHQVFVSFKDISAEIGEMVVKNAIELWQIHGNQTNPADFLRPRSGGFEIQQIKHDSRSLK